MKDKNEQGKIAILLPAEVWFCPFVKIYTQILDEYCINYDIINWDKTGTEDFAFISYHGNKGKSSLSKLLGYWKFSRFIKKTLLQNKYGKVIVFSSQIGVFCSRFLKKHYKSKYIFDFRDLSIEQSRIFKYPFLRLLRNSYKNVISSPGFIKCLPKGIDYCISHNFIESAVRSALERINVHEFPKTIDVLTIGGIRDEESNISVIKALGNDSRYTLRFIGKGPAATALEKYAKENDIDNIYFEGYYKKEDEPDIIKTTQFLNIFYPNKISHSTALSNRFYNSIIYRRPMITTKGQIQGDYCDRYNLGVAVTDAKELNEKLSSWLKKEDFNAYQDRCIMLLRLFLGDYDKFKAMLSEFIRE